jgi:hypothetical protein
LPVLPPGFQPSKYQPEQAVCSSPDCQRQRRADYHRNKVATDPEYAESCRESARKWRKLKPGYWKQYRDAHPDSAGRNRQQQTSRDRRQKLLRLANNTSASELSPCPATVWVIGTELRDLANNNLAAAQVWVLQGLSSPPGSAAASCKQQRSGVDAESAG